MRIAAALLLGTLLGRPAPAPAADLKPDTIAAWNQYVQAEEARLRLEPFPKTIPSTEPGGDTTPVPSGLIHRWRDAIFLPGVTLDRVLDGLMHPGTPPPQEDVLASRGSVATRIVEIDDPGTPRGRARGPGDDHGFLWRMNSYWRDTQAGTVCGWSSSR